MITDNSPTRRNDFALIVSLINHNARVLDIGCDDGALLGLLKKTRNTRGRGIEIDQNRVNLCVARGLSVIQGDADSDLEAFPDKVFDYVILSQTLQATRAPRFVLDQLLRIGNRAIVSIPNFAYWRYRFQLMTTGRMPQGRRLPYAWYDTPNIHLCTIRDFYELAEAIGARVVRAFSLGADQKPLAVPETMGLVNFFANEGLFMLERHPDYKAPTNKI